MPPPPPRPSASLQNGPPNFAIEAGAAAIASARTTGDHSDRLAPIFNILGGYLQVMGQMGFVLTLPLPGPFADFLAALAAFSLPIGQFTSTACVAFYVGVTEPVGAFGVDFVRAGLCSRSVHACALARLE